MALHLKVCLYVSLMPYLYLCSVIRARNFKREKQGVSFAKFIKASSVKLKTARLAHLKVSKLGECTFECLNHEQCRSTNFGRTSFDGKYSCELLRSDKFRRSQDLIASDDFDHYYIKTPCMGSPCKNGAECIPTSSKDDYICKCKETFTGKHCGKVNWIKMKPQPGNSSVCFGDRGDTPGIFATPSSGDVITFKLIHLNGNVSCAQGSYTNWGCNQGTAPERMGTFIADLNRTRLLPSDAELFGTELPCNKQTYYSLPGHTPDSPELLFDNFTNPLRVTVGQQFAVWFGEDLDDCGESDNGSGETCVDVYGLFV